MTLYQINEALKEIALSRDFVNEYDEGDIYDHLNSGEHKYSLVFLTLRSISSTGDTYDISCNLFYVDRLLKNNSNKLEIQSRAIETLKSIFRELEERYPMITVENDMYTPFTAQFSDLCAGVYSTINLRFVSENICE